MDPAWPSQPLHMEPGRLESRLASFANSEVSLMLKRPPLLHAKQLDLQLKVLLDQRTLKCVSANHWECHLTNKQLQLPKPVKQVETSVTMSHSWQQDYSCLKHCFLPTSSSQNRFSNHSPKHPAQDRRHSHGANQQDPQSVRAQMRTTWVTQAETRFSDQTGVTADCTSITECKLTSGGVRCVVYFAVHDLFHLDWDYKCNKCGSFRVDCIISASESASFNVTLKQIFPLCISGQVWVLQCWRQCQGQDQPTDGGGRWESWAPQAWRHHHRAHLWKHG